MNLGVVMFFFLLFSLRSSKKSTKKTHLFSLSLFLSSPSSPPLPQKKKGTAYVWDSKTAALEYALPGHSGSVNDVCFHPTEPVIASASSDGSLFVGELAS